MTEVTGGCACGRVRFSAGIEDHDAYLCHCRMCQRATGSVSIAFTEIDHGQVRWLSEPDWYDSSSIARRPFCAACGTSLGFAYKDPTRGKMDLTVASFDDPSRFTPVAHAGSESIHEAWLDTSGLPRHPTNAANEAATRKDRGDAD
ncbi:MAG TPA: GFA family protein [Sphingomonadaceae bacterium]|nr:GFA family protein [Sphingomonadaceae bacterium]